jgi:hypothetical protein
MREELKTKSTMADELIHGTRANSADQRLPFVKETEQPTLKTKLNKKDAKHLTAIRQRFAQGLVSGVIAIIKTGGHLPPALPISNVARRMFFARAKVLGTVAPAAAWAQALQAYP